MVHRDIRVCLMLITIVLILTGCWDQKEIEERATILGLAIDIAGDKKHPIPLTHPEGSEVPTSEIGKVEVTAQLAVPGQIPLGPSQGSQGTSQDRVWVVKAVGQTIDDAIQGLQQQLAHKVFFGQLQIIILSEDVAAKGIGHINEFLRRRPEIRRTAWMAVNEKDAAHTMQIAPKLERIPAIYLSTMFEEAVKLGKFPDNDLGKFWVQTSNKGWDGYLPYITTKEMENIEISGIAYFSGNKMAGKTKPYQIALFNGLTGQNPGGASLVVKLSKDESVMVQSTKRKVNYNASLKNGKPHFDINVEIWGVIREKNRQELKLDNQKMVRKIEQVSGKMLEKEMLKLIKETQVKKADIFGFGEYVRGDLASYWDQEVKTSEKWKEIYQNIDVNIRAKVHIQRVGMKAS
ncbi:Ger(x)C family spore germination protein [Neobacillus niacini]|uniref:Ger(x)C family spore germination protein n=1 Tax=Neobacillus niacini TaxID=86668 RepID=UPI0039833989